MGIFPFQKTQKSGDDEKKMLLIIKNVLEHYKPPYESKIKGLCRVSFRQTYGEDFQGNFEELWRNITKNSK